MQETAHNQPSRKCIVQENKINFVMPEPQSVFSRALEDKQCSLQHHVTKALLFTPYNFRLWVSDVVLGSVIGFDGDKLHPKPPLHILFS